MSRLLKNTVKNLPELPGVYQMKDADGKILYIGKAKNLRKRVQSYFRKDYEHSSRTRKLLQAVKYIDVTQTDTELEALLLETNLIKEHRPKYNILMKDDKSFVYIKVDLGEDFPRIRVVRERDLPKHRGPKVKLLGPKLASGKVYETLRILKKLFPFRHCNLDIRHEPQRVPLTNSMRQSRNILPGNGETPNKDAVTVTNRVIDFPCLDYFIKRCPGPCIGAVSPEEYKKVVQQILDFLGGQTEELENSLKEQMRVAASQKLFEKAGRIRDKLFALEGITERQKVTNLERRDTDVINFAAEMGRIYFNVFMIRGGKLIEQENFVFDALEMKEPDATLELAEILESFLTQYYEKAAEIPKEILIPEELENAETLQNWLSQKRGDRVALLNPKKGEKNHLLELSHKNAVQFARQYRIKWMAEQRGETALTRLAQVLALKEVPKRIEGFDISHLGGQETVGSMVVFEHGLPKSPDYRHFKLRTVQGKPDDYRSMEEVLMRRLKYLTKSQKANISIRTPSKKDFSEIENILQKEDARLSGDMLEKKDFLAVQKNKTLAGFGRLLKLSEKVTILTSLWIRPEYRGERLGYALMDKLIARSKLKRIYLHTHKKIENYYAEYGFLPLRDVPDALRERYEKLADTARDWKAEDTVFMGFEVKKRKADASFSTRPDLLVIDGGKGQLSTAVLALKRLKLEIPVISLAKRLEEIYLPGEKAPLLLEEGDEALKILQRIRDESHRFAITFQRTLHNKAMYN